MYPLLDAHAQSCSPNPQRCSSFDSDICVLGRCCFLWLSRRCDRERCVCHGIRNGPYGIKVLAKIWPSVHRDTPLSSPSAHQTIFMHPMIFYPMPKMIAHFILLHSGIMLRVEPCRAMWVCTPVRFDQCLLEKTYSSKIPWAMPEWSNQSHFIHIQFPKCIVKNT
jgi:hypothetical protein